MEMELYKLFKNRTDYDRLVERARELIIPEVVLAERAERADKLRKLAYAYLATVGTLYGMDYHGQK